jgi:hypothetical protein
MISAAGGASARGGEEVRHLESIPSEGVLEATNADVAKR